MERKKKLRLAPSNSKKSRKLEGKSLVIDSN